MAQNVTLIRPDGTEPRDVVNVQAATDDVNLNVAFDMPSQAPRQAMGRAAVQARPSPAVGGVQSQPMRRATAPVYKFPARAPPPPRPPPPPPPEPEELSDFANQSKIDPENSPEEGEEYEVEEGEEYEEFEEDAEEYEEEAPRARAPVVEPLPPFATITEERADIMFKLQRATRNGVHARTFGYNADIRDMRTELARVKTEQEVNASIAFQRQILMTICSGLEFANRRFPQYLDLELDGWSEAMMDESSSGKFDNVFQRLHERHASRMSLPPELTLIAMIGGSALSFHLTRKMLGGGKKKKDADAKKKRRRYVSSSSESESETESDDSLSPRERERRKYAKPAKKRSAKAPKAREMRGPGVDIGGLLGGASGMMGQMGSFLPQVPVPDLAPRFSRPPRPVKEGARPHRAVPAIEELGEDDASDRLSDIPSDDLDDVPSDLDSSAAESEPELPPRGPKGTKMIELNDKAPKKKRAPKNVIVI